jgi:hypothetical protein
MAGEASSALLLSRIQGPGLFGAGSPAGLYLGNEPSGLAIDFGNNSALVRGNPGQYLGTPAGLLTCTRASSATYFDANGILQTVGNNVLRRDHNIVTLAALGLRSEGTRTNAVLWNRDLTNAAWTPSNITAALDQTGIDGIVNSASSLTATAGNGTILQAITLTNHAAFQTAYVKWITGSGVVNMTMDGGTTWTAVTVTAAWTRVSIPGQTLVNPNVGFRIVTSGDAIAVDFVQNENNVDATSPIATTTTAVTRSGDSVKLLTTAFPYSALASTIDVHSAQASAISGSNFFDLQTASGSANEIITQQASGSVMNVGIGAGGVGQTTTGNVTSPANTLFNHALAVQANDFAFSRNGATCITAATITMPSAATQLSIGINIGNGIALNGTILKLKYLPRRATNAELQAFST